MSWKEGNWWCEPIGSGHLKFHAPPTSWQELAKGDDTSLWLDWLEFGGSTLSPSWNLHVSWMRIRWSETKICHPRYMPRQYSNGVIVTEGVMRQIQQLLHWDNTPLQLRHLCIWSYKSSHTLLSSCMGIACLPAWWLASVCCNDRRGFEWLVYITRGCAHPPSHPPHV